jgi:hypothetical protein
MRTSSDTAPVQVPSIHQSGHENLPDNFSPSFVETDMQPKEKEDFA